MHALVAEAMKKAAIIWVAPAADRPPYPLWCLPSGGALYVVSGGSEQPAIGLTSAGTVIVTARGDHGGRIASWTASVERLAPDGADWAEIATALAGKRLNATMPVDALVETWIGSSEISRLTPIGDDLQPPPTGSGAATPVPTSAANRTVPPAPTRAAPPAR